MKRWAVLAAAAALLAVPYAGWARMAGPEDLSKARIHRGAGPGTRATGVMGSYPDAEPRFHSGSTLACSDCHISHASQTHLRDPNAPGMNEPVPYVGNPNPKLLRAGDPLDLCLTCHDGRSFAPDVLNEDANGLAQRSAGFFGNPDAVNPHGHDLGHGLPKAPDELCIRCHWGSPDDRKVTCIDCHAPHGNGRARNLQWASWPQGTPELGLFSSPLGSGMARYEAANVSYGSLGSEALREVTNICLDCHHVFTGGWYIDPDGNGIHNRHPSFDSERGSPNTISQGDAQGTTVSSHWVGGTGSGFYGTTRVRSVVPGATGYAAGTVVDAGNGVFCLSCHRAHGSDQDFGMVWPLSGGLSATGCDQCHLKANVTQPAPAVVLAR